jgi:hypothetical protein
MKYLILFALIFSPLASFAQGLPASFTETAVIELSPEIPSPRESVTAKVKGSFYSSLTRSNIVWSENGSVKKSGIGETEYQFQSPPAGTPTRLSVTVTKETGEVLNSSINIRTADLDLMYEANTYVPPFYRGRSLFTHQSVVTVAAVATFKEGGVPVPKSKIIYTWERDGAVNTSISGVGKDSIQIEGSVVSDPFYIAVTAETLNSNLKARKRVLINPIKPNVVLYENNPIYGSIFERALMGTFNFDREEVGITAIPYFFSAQDRSSGNLEYSWFENGRAIGNPTFGSFINYLNPGKEKSGISNIGVKVEHSENVLQSGNNSFIINVLGLEQFDTINTDDSTPF